MAYGKPKAKGKKRGVGKTNKRPTPASTLSDVIHSLSFELGLCLDYSDSINAGEVTVKERADGFNIYDGKQNIIGASCKYTTPAKDRIEVKVGFLNSKSAHMSLVMMLDSIDDEDDVIYYADESQIQDIAHQIETKFSKLTKRVSVTTFRR